MVASEAGASRWPRAQRRQRRLSPVRRPARRQRVAHTRGGFSPPVWRVGGSRLSIKRRGQWESGGARAELARPANRAAGSGNSGGGGSAASHPRVHGAQKPRHGEFYGCRARRPRRPREIESERRCEPNGGQREIRLAAKPQCGGLLIPRETMEIPKCKMAIDSPSLLSLFIFVRAIPPAKMPPAAHRVMCSPSRCERRNKYTRCRFFAVPPFILIDSISLLFQYHEAWILTNAKIL